MKKDFFSIMEENTPGYLFLLFNISVFGTMLGPIPNVRIEESFLTGIITILILNFTETILEKNNIFNKFNISPNYNKYLILMLMPAIIFNTVKFEFHIAIFLLPLLFLVGLSAYHATKVLILLKPSSKE